MQRRPIVAGNWKMFKTASEAAPMLAELAALVRDPPCDVVVCPPFTALDRARGALDPPHTRESAVDHERPTSLVFVCHVAFLSSRNFSTVLQTYLLDR